MTTSLVPVEVGESTAIKFDWEAYVKALNGGYQLTRQQALAAAYDAACAALLGPNDVQIEGTRQFKKKSAWLKLARHFGISTYLPDERVRSETIDGSFLATVVARAVAPWGQTSENVGACSTDEATGRRIITKADAIATAATRALNRAISNLIAMGEVSAEEINARHPAAKKAETPEDLLWKGKPLTDYPSGDLVKLREWCRKKDVAGFGPKIEAIDALLAAREGE